METSLSAKSANTSNKKLIFYIIGYFFIGTIWIFFNSIPLLPIGLLGGVVRIFQRKKREEGLRWRYLLIALIAGALIGAGAIPGIHIGIFNVSLGS